jgi:hypothetical protein
VAALPVRGDAESRIGLCVVARQYAARGRLAYSLAADSQLHDLRMMSVHSLLTLAAQVTADRMTHHEVVKLLKSGFALDFVIDLLDRPAAAASAPQSQEPPEPAVRTAHAERHEPAFWVATITGSEAASRDRLLESVIAHRRVLAICHAGRFTADGSPGDWVCFFLPGKGIVGHAQLMSVVEDSAAVVRHGSRFSRVYRLADVTLYDQPVAQALRAGRPFALPPVDIPLSGACLTEIARQDFHALTTYREPASRADRIRSATA